MCLWNRVLWLRLSGLALGTLLALGVTTGPVWSQYSLKSRRDYRTGDHPVQVATVDFDEDGLLDLISADEQSNTISLMKGFGDGTWRRLATVTAGSGPTGVVAVDVNNDGNRDLVASNYLSLDVTVNLGDGMGGFGAPIRSSVSPPAFGLVVGDWNADGKPDVATVHSNADKMSVLTGLGNGSFGNLTQITVGDAPSQVLTGDFNADSKADLVVVNTNSASVQVWHGDGLGGFSLPTTLSQGAGSGPVAAVAGDLNGDTRSDLVVANRDAVNLKVFLANTSGGFQNPTTLTLAASPRGLTIADIDADGDLDLIAGLTPSTGSGQVAVLSNNGTGGFASPVLTPTSPYPTSLTTGDYNQDGKLDVVTASLTGDTLSLLEATSGGAFLVAGKVQLALQSFPASIVVTDFSADGKADFATANNLTNDVAIAKGDGLGGFLAPTTVSTGTLSGPQALTMVDPNRDGKTDLVTVNIDNTMSVLMNNGTGTFTATNGLLIGACNSPIAVASGEISGDLNPDLAYVCDASRHLCTRRGTGGSGASAFGAPLCTLVDDVPEGVALGRYDYDALQDMAVTASTLNWVEIAISDGFGGVVDIPATFVTGEEPRGVARADLNNDGVDDLVVANSASATVSALLGDGFGAFTFPSIQSPAGEGPVAVALVDLNVDGKLDAAVVNANANDISFLLGDGFGNFVKAGDFGARDLPLSVGAADLNGDGKPDLVVADNFSDTITILLNQSTLGDPLQGAQVLGNARAVYRWGIVPGAVYDVIRGNVTLVTQGPSSFNLGPVACLANNLVETDSASVPDAVNPPVGQAFFYFVRPIIAGAPGNYTVSTNGKPGLPASGGCL